MSRIGHIVWDWNGTLLDDTDACVLALNDILRPRKLGPVSAAQYREHFCFPVYDYYVKLGFDFGRDEWERVTKDFHRFYAVYSRDVPLRKGAIETLERIRKLGLPMSILSASESELLATMLKQRGISDYFKAVYGRSDFFADSKVALGRIMCNAIEGGAGTVLLVGDTDHDAEVAHELGCRCLLLCGGHQSDERLKSCGCDMAKTITEVADYIEREIAGVLPELPVLLVKSPSFTKKKF